MATIKSVEKIAVKYSRTAMTDVEIWEVVFMNGTKKTLIDPTTSVLKKYMGRMKDGTVTRSL